MQRLEMVDLIFLLAGAEEKTRKAISELRLEIAERLGLRKKRRIQITLDIGFSLV